MLFLVTLFVSHAASARANALDRDGDPVILAGSSLPSLIGVDPGRIVAFRFDGSWEQIPVQIDERAIVDFGTVYNTTPTGYTFLAYTDTSTFTGPDPDTTFDADDEPVFMAKDAGIVSSEGLEPMGVVMETGIELAITNPIKAEPHSSTSSRATGRSIPGWEPLRSPTTSSSSPVTTTRSLAKLPAGVYFARAAGPGGARHSSCIVILR